MWRENHASHNAPAEPFGFIMWRQCELYSETKLNPEWKSFRYHINSNPFNYRATKHCNGQWTSWRKQAGTAKSCFKKSKYINKVPCSFIMHVMSAQLFVKLQYSFSNSRYRDALIVVCKCNLKLSFVINVIGIWNNSEIIVYSPTLRAIAFKNINLHANG